MVNAFVSADLLALKNVTKDFELSMFSSLALISILNNPLSLYDSSVCFFGCFLCILIVLHLYLFLLALCIWAKQLFQWVRSEFSVLVHLTDYRGPGARNGLALPMDNGMNFCLIRTISGFECFLAVEFVEGDGHFCITQQQLSFPFLVDSSMSSWLFLFIIISMSSFCGDALQFESLGMQFLCLHLRQLRARLAEQH